VTVRFNALEGDIVGTINGEGYLQVMINLKTYQVHRLVWLYHHGYTPEGMMDHINRIRTDNRIENLREVSRSCNMRNRKQQRSSSGVKGVTWWAHRNKWIAQIQTDMKNRYVGASIDLLEAVCHRLAAEQCLNWAGCDSTSPSYLYVTKAINPPPEGTDQSQGDKP